MPLYRYQAVSSAGELLHGELEASDEAAVVAHLQRSGQLPLRADRVTGNRLTALLARKRGAARVSRRELAVFTRELSSLLHAGLALDRALQVIVDVAAQGTLRALAARIQQSVRGGAALSDALEAEKDVFGRFYVAMVRAAEAAGALDAGLARLAEHEERAKALRDSVVSALIYPAILVTVAAASLLVILAYVVPQFTQLFADAGRALPVSTQIVVGTAQLLKSYGWLLAVAIIVLIAALRLQLSRHPAARYRWDRWLLRLPLAGELVRRIEMARFSRSLGTLMASGVSLLVGLAIVKEIVSNRALAESLDLAAEALKAGQRLADPLMAAGGFPLLGLQLIKVGEETGRLDEMLLRVAELYDREVVAATQRLLALLEPVLIVGLGIVIGGVIMSILLAIVKVNDLPL